MILLTATAASGAYRDTAALTTVHFAVLAVLAALTIAAIAWGIRLKRGRIAAQQEQAERAEELKAHPQEDSRIEPAPAPATRDAEPAPAPAPAPAPPAHRAEPEAAAESRVEVADPTLPTSAGPGSGHAAARPADPAPANLAFAGADGGYALTDIKGLGPKAVPLLAAQGVTNLAGLAALDGDRAAAVDAAMGPLAGRIARDRWVEQARLLTAGDRAGFEAAFGKLG